MRERKRQARVRSAGALARGLADVHLRATDDAVAGEGAALELLGGNLPRRVRTQQCWDGKSLSDSAATGRAFLTDTVYETGSK